MIECLATCLLMGKAEVHPAADGRRIVSARMRVQVEGDWVLGNVVTTTNQAGDALLALRDGEAIALAGSLLPTAWVDDDGGPRIILKVIAHTALTVRHARMRPNEAPGTGA